MDRLETLWTSLTNLDFPKNPSDVSDQLRSLQPVLKDGLLSYKRISKNEAALITSEDVLSSLKSLATKEEDLEDQAQLTASVIQFLYVNIKTATTLVTEAAAAEGKEVKNLAGIRADVAVDIVLRNYFSRRRLILAIHRYIYESYRSLENAKLHPLQGVFSEFVENLRDSVEFSEGLVQEYSFILSRLRDYAEHPSAQSEWLSLQLQEFRDLLILLFDLAGQLPKTRTTVEDIVKPLITCGQWLQRFPVTTDSSVGTLQLQLIEQVNDSLTIFVFRYFSIGTQIFLRQDPTSEYLDEAFPTGSSLSSALPSSLLWSISRLEVDPQHPKSLQNLSQVLTDFNPFFLLANLLRSSTLVRDSREILAGIVFDFGEQFLRMFSVDGLGPMAYSVYDLAEELFQYPKEVTRFWQRWTEGAGTELRFSWGYVFVYARDQFPKSFSRFITFATSLLKGISAAVTRNTETVAQLNRMLWNLDRFFEEFPKDCLQNVTMIKAETEGISIIRTDVPRYPLGSDAVVIPAGTIGSLYLQNHNVELRWALDEAPRYSVWTICAYHLDRFVAATADDFAEALPVVLKICKFYTVTVKADARIHSDLSGVLQLLCRALGSVFRLLLSSLEEPKDYTSVHRVVRAIFELCVTEVPYHGPQFLTDLDLVTHVFPRAVQQTSSDFEWIRNGNFTWFSPFWQQLCRESPASEFAKTLEKLAQVMVTICDMNNGICDSNALLQQSSLFVLNIGLQFLAQLTSPTDGLSVLQFVNSALQNSETSKTSVSSIACDCLYEGPAGQAIVELLCRGNRLLNLTINNDIPTCVVDFISSMETDFVRVNLEIICRLLHFLPVRSSQHVTSFERALLTVEKSRQIQGISVTSGFGDSSKPTKHPVLHLCRFITSAKDAKHVEFATNALSRLIVLQQPSLMTVVRENAEEFLMSVFRLLKQPNAAEVVELWKFMGHCDAKQPRLLDLLINLQYNAESKKYTVDIESLPSLLDVVLNTLKNPPCPEAETACLAFCLDIFASQNDYAEYLGTKADFWEMVFDILAKVPISTLSWEQKLPAAYAADLISLQVNHRTATVALLSEPFVAIQWTHYFESVLPKIFMYLNKDIPKLLVSLDADSSTMKCLTRFFNSLCSMHILVFKQKKLQVIVSNETKQDTTRTMLMLLNRSLLRTYSGEFTQCVASRLGEMLHSWREDFCGTFFPSVFHLVEEFTVLVCGRDREDHWNDIARHAILANTLLILDQVAGNQDENAAVLPVSRIRNVFQAAVEVISYSALNWNVAMEQEDLKGTMLSYAVGIITRIVRLHREDSEEFSFPGVLETFRSNCVVEILLTKLVQLISARRLPFVMQKFLNLFLVMSEKPESCVVINQAGFCSCLGLPLANLVVSFQELLTERNTTENSTMDDAMEIKLKTAAAESFFELYICALIVQFNVTRHDPLRFDDYVKFVGVQLACMADVLNCLQNSPTIFTFRLVEILTRLITLVCQRKSSVSYQSACSSDIPTTFHLICGQLMQRVEELKSDPNLLSTQPVDAIVTTGLNCLEVLYANHPGTCTLLTEEFVLSDLTDKLIVECSFSSPVSLKLSPTFSFGTLIHVVREGINVLSQEQTIAYPLVFSNGARSIATPFAKLLNFIERSAGFFLGQAMTFAVGLSDSSGERWQETLRELNNEIMDLRHELHTFLADLESAAEAETGSTAETDPSKSILELLVRNMMGFRIFYEDIRDDLDVKSFSTSASRTDRKKVTFML